MASQHISQITFTSPPHHDADPADDGLNDDGDGEGDDDGGGFADFTTNHLFSLLTASPTMPEPFYQFYTRVLPPILHQDTVHQSLKTNFTDIFQLTILDFFSGTVGGQWGYGSKILYFGLGLTEADGQGWDMGEYEGDLRSIADRGAMRGCGLVPAPPSRLHHRHRRHS